MYFISKEYPKDSRNHTSGKKSIYAFSLKEKKMKKRW
jgi:hypothetical protein